MRLMRYVAIIGMVAAFGSISSRADIAYQLAASGTFADGGSFAGGAHANLGFLYQSIWGPSEPTQAATTGGGEEAGHFVLFESYAGTPITGYAENFGYIYYSDQAASATQHTDSDVGGADINNGFLYFRLFDTAAAAAGDRYYQSTPIATSGLPDVDLSSPPIAPAGIVPLNATGVGTPQAMTGTVVPEPTTLALIALSGMMIAIRRARRD
jgi:hypothetical protein